MCEMSKEKEKKVLRYIWLDIEVLKIWNRYLDLAHSGDDDKEPKMEVLKKEIDNFEQKMFDISEGIRYNDVMDVKEKYNLDTGSILFGMLLHESR